MASSSSSDVDALRQQLAATQQRLLAAESAVSAKDTELNSMARGMDAQHTVAQVLLKTVAGLEVTIRRLQTQIRPESVYEVEESEGGDEESDMGGPAAHVTASAASSSAAGASSSRAEEEVCERCNSADVTADNPIVLCDVEGCPRGLHFCCFARHVEPEHSLLEVAQADFHNFCTHHVKEAMKHQKRSAAHTTTPQHNLPPIVDQPPSQSGGDSPLQIYMAATRQSDALTFNLKQLQLEVRPSGISAAGPGLFAARDFAIGEVVGYFYGIFVAPEWFDKAKIDAVRSAPVFPACSAGEEDFSVPVWNGSWRALDVGCVQTKEEDLSTLIVSDQCPMVYANDPRDHTRINIEARVPKAYTETGSGVLDWKLVPVVCKAAIKSGSELFLDYNWTDALWTAMLGQMKLCQARARASLSFGPFTAEQLHAWASDYDGFGNQISGTDRESLIQWLVDHDVAPPKNAKAAQKCFLERQQLQLPALSKGGGRGASSTRTSKRPRSAAAAASVSPRKSRHTTASMSADDDDPSSAATPRHASGSQRQAAAQAASSRKVPALKLASEAKGDSESNSMVDVDAPDEAQTAARAGEESTHPTAPGAHPAAAGGAGGATSESLRHISAMKCLSDTLADQDAVLKRAQVLNASRCNENMQLACAANYWKGQYQSLSDHVGQLAQRNVIAEAEDALKKKLAELQAAQPRDIVWDQYSRDLRERVAASAADSDSEVSADGNAR
jgi:hypothetical protein